MTAAKPPPVLRARQSFLGLVVVVALFAAIAACVVMVAPR